MKLRKIIKHLDCFSDCELLDEEGNVLWEGSTIALQVHTYSKKEFNHYLSDCRKDKDFEAISELRSAEKFLDYKLDTNLDYNAVEAILKGKIVKFSINLKTNKKGGNAK